MLFDKKNGMHLFIIFILLGAMMFMVSSYIFVSNQAKETATIINNENLKGKFSAVEQYVSEFIESHERSIYKISTDSYVVSAVLEGVDDEYTLRDQMFLIKPYELDTFVNLYDFEGEGLYVEFEFTEKINKLIVDSINNESMLNNKSYIFFKNDEKNYLLLTEPVRYNLLPEGVVTYTILLDDTRLIGRLTADSAHWFGISQSQFDWAMSPPEGWEAKFKLIPEFGISLIYASSPEFLEKTEADFLRNLFMRMAVATCITIFLLYFLGRKILVSPFQSLARSERLLEQQSDELKLKEAESTRLARVAKHMRDAVIFTDSDSKITWVNSAFEDISGFQKEEVEGGKPSAFLQGPDTDTDTVCKITELIKKRASGTFEILSYTKNKKNYWLEVQIGPLFDNRETLEGFMVVGRDITERKKLEDTLKHSVKKAEAANIAKSNFLASMSHELRTPMNGVLGMTELIKDSSLNPEQQEMVDTLFSSGTHMLSVLNDILDFSKIEAGKLDLNVTNFSVSELVTDISRVYKSLCEEKGLQFSLTFYTDKNDVYVADKTRIQQILQNLLNNAWKFTEQGHVSASIKVLTDGAQPLLELDVSDTGVGIGKEMQKNVFKPFLQAESDTTRRFGGTGLGLAIISELVHAMNGNIDLESQLGIGSRFRVTIPIKLGEHNQENKSKNSTVFDGSGLRVLIVEDNKINVTVMSMFLKKRGFVCEVAENGQVGVDKVNSAQFDLVVMDNHMPVMDGIDATKAIKALKLADEPLIIGCTADAFEETRVNMISAGCTDVVTKPIHSSKLDEVLISNLSVNP